MLREIFSFSKYIKKDIVVIDIYTFYCGIYYLRVIIFIGLFDTLDTDVTL